MYRWQLLALHATLQSLAADTTTTARWIDTEGAFNATRARNVVTALGFEVGIAFVGQTHACSLTIRSLYLIV